MSNVIQLGRVNPLLSGQGKKRSFVIRSGGVIDIGFGFKVCFVKLSETSVQIYILNENYVNGFVLRPSDGDVLAFENVCGCIVEVRSIVRLGVVVSVVPKDGANGPIDLKRVVQHEGVFDVMGERYAV